QGEVLTALGGLPPANEHCALLAAAALQEALGDYRTIQRDPWKKAYRKYGV
ncbi:iron-sulfur cluster assembly scaffold protein, partial [Chloroflexota bacterium]